MSLIDKIDAEIERLHEEQRSMRSGVDAERVWLKIDEAEKIKEFVLSEQKEPCVWTQQDEDKNIWECSKCGALWVLDDGTPKDNEMNYCPVCGRPLNQPYTE